MFDVSVPVKYDEIADSPQLFVKYNGNKRDVSYDKLLLAQADAVPENSDPYPNKVTSVEGENTDEKTEENTNPPTMNLTIEVVRAERLPSHTPGFCDNPPAPNPLKNNFKFQNKFQNRFCDQNFIKIIGISFQHVKFYQYFQF